MENYDSYNQTPLYRSQQQAHRGTMILIFGILGILACGIFGILAWVMGNQDLRKIQDGVMDPSGLSNTNLGKILGIVGCVIWGLSTAYYMGLFVSVFRAF